jgi:hypothetical protein
MLFVIKPSRASVARPRVTPDPSQAAALEEKIKALNYYPENGFHRDRSQDRVLNSRRAMR